MWSQGDSFNVVQQHISRVTPRFVTASDSNPRSLEGMSTRPARAHDSLTAPAVRIPRAGSRSARPLVSNSRTHRAGKSAQLAGDRATAADIVRQRSEERLEGKRVGLGGW